MFKLKKATLSSQAAPESNNPHAGMPLPQLWKPESSKTGRIWLTLPLEATDIDMLEDENRLRWFPFDVLRLDFGMWMSGARRTECSNQVLVRFFSEDPAVWRVPLKTLPATNTTLYAEGEPASRVVQKKGASKKAGVAVHPSRRDTQAQLQLVVSEERGDGPVDTGLDDSPVLGCPSDPALDEHKGGRVAINCRPRSGELELIGVSFASAQHTSAMTGACYSDIIWSLHIRRRPALYLWKGVVPLLLCFVYGCCGITLDPITHLGDRLNLLAALFVSCFAIQWTLTERVPQLPYLTLLDHLLFAVVLGLAMMAIGSCVAHILNEKRLGLVDGVTLGAIAACWFFQAWVSGAARLAINRVCGTRIHNKAGESSKSSFGTRPLRQGATPMCAVCCTTPGNTFVIWEKDFGSGLAKRFGVPGEHLGADEPF
jgi:hypothetical protein